ncbi:MAG TPA: hypothetical protein VGD75_05785 [Bradyrhizobium sp.]
MTPARRDHPRRVTPELMATYKKKAHQLRAEAYRNMVRKLLAALARLTRLL